MNLEILLSKLSKPIAIFNSNQNVALLWSVLESVHTPYLSTERIHIPKLEAINFIKINTDDLKTAEHKMNQYSDQLDKRILQHIIIIFLQGQKEKKYSHWNS